MPTLTQIGTDGIKDDAITAGKIVAGAVVADIADDTITGGKFANDIAISTTGVITTTGAITGGTLTGTLQTAAQTNITSVGTLTSFRSTGIDDNADATAMIITSDEAVGIGKSLTPNNYSNYQCVTVGGSDATTGSLIDLEDSSGNIDGRISGESGYLLVGADPSGATADSKVSFQVDGTEMMKIDSSGRVLIGSAGAAYATAGASDLVVGNANNEENGITIVSGASTGNSSLNFSDSNSGDGRRAGQINYQHQYDEYQIYGQNLNQLCRFTSAGNLVPTSGWLKQTNSTASGGQFYNGTNISGYNGANFNEFNSTVGNEFILALKNWNSGTDQEGLYIGHEANTSNDNSHFFECGNDAGTKVKVNGNGHFATAPGTYGSISDERIKKDIKDASDQWDDIKELKFKKYKLYNSDQEYMGLVAQEVEKVCPSLVYEETPSVQDIAHNSVFGTLYEEGDEIPDGRKVGDRKEIKSRLKVMKYSILYTKAVKALQEAMTRIETLEDKVKALEEA